MRSALERRRPAGSYPGWVMRHRRAIMAIALLVVPVIALVRGLACRETVTGIVTDVRGGQVIVVGDRSVLLDGVVAGKHGPQPRRGVDVLTRAALGKRVRCSVCRRMEQASGRGQCEGADGVDLSLLLVKAGAARDCPARSGGRYARFEVPLSREIALPDRCRPSLRKGPWPGVR